MVLTSAGYRCLGSRGIALLARLVSFPALFSRCDPGLASCCVSLWALLCGDCRWFPSRGILRAAALRSYGAAPSSHDRGSALDFTRNADPAPSARLPAAA